MVKSCCVKYFKSESYAGCGISFHKFPKDEDRKKKWLDIVPRSQKITKNSVVCSNHFKKEDFHEVCSRQLLKEHVIPSIFPLKRSPAPGEMNCPQQAGRARRRATRTPVPALGRRERAAREERYAASKWGAAPSAAALPPPPTHWRRDGRCRPEPDRALPLKLLLNVA